MPPANQHIDVSVIGGGVAGIGVALECAKLGLSVRLIERSRLCSATSGNSLRIIHGGIRYLQNLDFSRTIESIRAQAALLEFDPHNIKQLPCLMPLRGFGTRSRLPVSLAACTYDTLGRRYGRRKRSAILPAKFFSRHHPNLRSLTPYGALLWYDAYIADLAGFEARLWSQLHLGGVTVYQDTMVEGVTRCHDHFTLTTSPHGETLQSGAVINCAGAWLDSVKTVGIKIAPRNSHWCRAFNIITTKQLSDRFAIGLHSVGGRLLFFVPRGNNCAIGTGYLPCSTNTLEISSAESDDFLRDINLTVPQLGLTRANIVATEVGILPSTASDLKVEPRPRGRIQLTSDHGYFELLSTKYTTFLTQAEKIAAAAAKWIKNPRISTQ